MAKVLVINGVWTSLVCGMLCCAVFLHTQKARIVPGDFHLAAIQDSMKGATRAAALGLM